MVPYSEKYIVFNYQHVKGFWLFASQCASGLVTDASHQGLCVQEGSTSTAFVALKSETRRAKSPSIAKDEQGNSCTEYRAPFKCGQHPGVESTRADTEFLQRLRDQFQAAVH